LKIPSKLKAFGRIYKVERESEVTGKMECWGYFDSYRDTVVLKKRGLEFTPGREKQVFMHEIFHILDDSLHIKLDEDQIQLLAVGLSTIIDDNKLNFADNA
jgi:hypothetical protein